MPDAGLGSWLYSNNAAPAWANALFSYGNKTVTGTIGVAAFNFTSSQDSGQTTANTQVSLGPVYLHFNLPGLLGKKTHVDWDVGAFGNRYGTAGKYDYGAYGMFLIGATGAIGETVGVDFDLDPIHASPRARPRRQLLHRQQVRHRRCCITCTRSWAFQQNFKIGLHYLTSWTTDDRPPAPPTTPDGRLSVIGADMRFNGGIAGELYFGVAQAKADHAYLGGPGDLLGQCARRYGHARQLLRSAQRRHRHGDVASVPIRLQLRHLGALPRALPQELLDRRSRPEAQPLRHHVVGQHHPRSRRAMNYDGVKKSKVGAELIYSPLSFLSLGGRFDRIMPTSKHSDQNFSVVSPKVVIKTNFFSHDSVTIQYSRYMYGAAYPRMASCGSYVHENGANCNDFDRPATPGNSSRRAASTISTASPLDTAISGRALRQGSHLPRRLDVVVELSPTAGALAGRLVNQRYLVDPEVERG